LISASIVSSLALALVLVVGLSAGTSAAETEAPRWQQVNRIDEGRVIPSRPYSACYGVATARLDWGLAFLVNSGEYRNSWYRSLDGGGT
jgi:hypothetical protein